MREWIVLLPDEAMPVIIVVLVIGVVAGLTRPRLLVGFSLLLALMPLIGHLFDAFLTAVPLWFALLIVGTLMTWMARAALSVLIGREAAARALGALVVDVIKSAFRASLLPVRVVGWLLRRRERVMIDRWSALFLLAVSLSCVGCGGGARQAERAAAKWVSGGSAIRTVESRVLLRDGWRDMFTRTRRLAAPRTVYRYMSGAEARSVRRQGIAAGRHFTATAPAGRPMSGARAARQYGLPVVPARRATVTLPAGTPVKANKVLGGGRGVGELKVMDSVPKGRIKGSVRLSK